MFPDACLLTRVPMPADLAREVIAAAKRENKIVVALNPSHAATIAAMRERFGIDVPIPERAPVVRLKHGDILIVLGVAGLPRLEGRHEYMAEEIEAAAFSFSMFSVEAS